VGVGELLPAGPLEGLGGAVVLQPHVKVEPGLRYKSCDLGLLVSANIKLSLTTLRSMRIKLIVEVLFRNNIVI
jgi:hypothetical protein